MISWKTAEERAMKVEVWGNPVYMNKNIVGSEGIILTQVGENGYEGDDLRVINRKSKKVLGLTFCCIFCGRRCDEWLKKRKWVGNS